MALWDELQKFLPSGSPFGGGGGSTSLAGGGKGPTGLFDMLGGEEYDLGSRLMMLGAHLEGNPQGAARIREGMIGRREDRKAKAEAARLQAEQRRQYQDYLERSGHPSAKMTRENPELLDLIMPGAVKAAEKAREDKEAREYAESLTAQQRVYEEAQELAKEGRDPVFQKGLRENQFVQGFGETLGNRAEQLGGMLQAPGAGVHPNAMTMTAHAMRSQTGIRDLTEDEAQALLAASQAGPKEYSEALSRLKDDRANQQKIEQQAAIRKGSRGIFIDPDTNQMMVEETPGAPGQDPMTGQFRDTEADKRTRTVQRYGQGTLDAIREGFRPLQERANSIGVLTEESAAKSDSMFAPFISEGARMMMSGIAQAAYQGIIRLANTGVLSVSGAAFSRIEPESLAKEVVPRASDDEEMSRYRWRRLNVLAQISDDPQARLNYKIRERNLEAQLGRPLNQDEIVRLVLEITDAALAKQPDLPNVLGELPPREGQEQGGQQPGGFQLPPDVQNDIDQWAQ